MIDEKLKSYIKEALEKGYTKEYIKRALSREGHNLEVIEQHFRALGEGREKSPNALLYLLIFFVIISTILGIANLVLYMKQASPQKYDTLVTESKELCAEGNFDKAFKNLNYALRLDKTSSRAFGVMGFCYLHQNKFLESVPVLTEAVRLNSQEPLLYYRLGVAYCNLNSYNLGISNLKRAIDMSPGNPDFYNSIADCYSKVGNNEETQKYLSMLNEITSKNISLKSID